jgi:predicted nucleotidyltransferase
MGRIPKKPEDIFGKLTEDYKSIFGEDLLSIILYGSGASGHYIPGKSDLNFLIILAESRIDDLDTTIPIVAHWRKRGVAIPLFMTRSYVESSLDTYPIEFLNMRRHYIVVHGKDFLADLDFAPEHLRLQLERELKGKIIRLQERYLATEGKPRQLRELIRISLTAFLSMFAALLHLKGLSVPTGRRELIEAATHAISLDPSTFLKCMDVREGTYRLSSAGIRDLFKNYLKDVRVICTAVDCMKIT